MGLDDVFKKMDELEKLCPGVVFYRTKLKEPIVRLRFEAPTTGGHPNDFSVDLGRLGTTAEEWLDVQIKAYTLDDPSRDMAYNVICRKHGKVQIGYKNYIDQMSNPYARWICPLCSGIAEFDDETYEAYSDGGLR